MIYDKIKIYVTAQIAETLRKDAESFEFFKKDERTVNKNAFLTRLILNYFDEFRENRSAFLQYLNKTVSAASALRESAIHAVCLSICEHVYELTAVENNEKFDKLVSLKPTKESQALIDYIESYQLEGCSLSEYFRNMFAAYARLPQEKREAILFKKQRETLYTAIQTGRKVFLQVSHAKRSTLEIEPYALTAGKEEMHGYLLGVCNGSCLPLRLSRIETVTLLEEKTNITEEQKALFEKMITYGPQFACRPWEGEVIVELTERGVEQFKKMYVHRPIPTKVEGNLYYFECSHSQITQYFQRFGANAFVRSPERLRDTMLRFHRSAYFRYLDRKSKLDPFLKP